MCPAPAGTRAAAACSGPTEPSWQQLAAVAATGNRLSTTGEPRRIRGTFERATHIGATHGLSGAPTREPAVAEKKQNKSHGRDGTGERERGVEVGERAQLAGLLAVKDDRSGAALLQHPIRDPIAAHPAQF